MSAGLASVVTKVGMIPDFLEDKENCLLISPKKIEELVLSLEILFKDIELRKKIAKNAYFYSNSNFTIDNGLELISNAINNLTPNEFYFMTFNKLDIFTDKVLLITGGTGSFGNAVVSNFLNSGLKELRIYSRDEKTR